MKLIGHFILLFSFISVGISQNIKIDSLKKVVATTSGKQKHDALIFLSAAFQDISADSSIFYAKKCVSYAREINNASYLTNSYITLSQVYSTAGEYQEAQKAAFAAQHLADSIKNSELYARSTNAVGYIFAKINNQQQAIKYYRLAIEPAKKMENQAMLGNVYNNMGNAFMAMNINDSALNYLTKGLEIRKKLNDLKGIGYSYNNLGNVYVNLKNYKKSSEYYSKSLEIKKQLGDMRGIISSYSNLALNQLEIGDKEGAKKLIEESVKIAVQINTKDYLRDAYESAIEIYDQSGDYKKANEYYKLLKKLDEKLFNESLTQQIAEMDAKYQSAKKQSEIELLKKDGEFKEVTISKQRYLNYGAIVIIILAIITAVIIYRGYKQKNESNKLLQSKNEIIESKNKDILDSITYAKRLQTAVLPDEEDIKQLVKEHFIFYQPKDIVSGDFYFIEPIRTNDGYQLVALAVADCTGHGVPGAFMSMLGCDILKNSLTEKTVNSASDALNYLNNRITKVLRSTANTQVRDGMDIAFCVLDPKTLKLYFSGANNPCWIIKKDKSFIELKPDKQPIGFFEKSAPFSLSSQQLEEGDMLYLFSDGYPDQFGGPKGKKFKYKRLQEKLTEVHHRSMTEQKRFLENEFNEWKGKLAQTDDICLLGVRV